MRRRAAATTAIGAVTTMASAPLAVSAAPVALRSTRGGAPATRRGKIRIRTKGSRAARIRTAGKPARKILGQTAHRSAAIQICDRAARSSAAIRICEATAGRTATIAAAPIASACAISTNGGARKRVVNRAAKRAATSGAAATTGAAVAIAASGPVTTIAGTPARARSRRDLAWPRRATPRCGAAEAQRSALAALRDAAKAAAQRLASDCPQEIPAAPAARLEAVEQGIDATLKALEVVEPKLQAFYGALNDEQKARLYRDMAPPAASNPAAATDARAAQAVQDERRDSYSSRRHRWRDYAAAREAAAREASARNAAPRPSTGPGWGRMCEELAGALRNWPVREIEQGVQLSAQQRVAFYELVTASLKAAETLGSACPAEAALTPVGRMEAMRKRLSAVRAATAAIRAPLAHFYEALDQGQQLRFAGMS